MTLRLAMTELQVSYDRVKAHVINILREALCCLQYMADQTTGHCIHTVEPSKIQHFPSCLKYTYGLTENQPAIHKLHNVMNQELVA